MWQAVARSVRDNVIAEFVVQGVRLGGFVMLARALGPGQFGIFRVLLVLSVLAALSNDAGIPDALVQRKEITAAHEATAWWLGMLTALGAAVVLYLTAPLIAAAMDMPGLTGGARLLCLPILLDATTVVPSARLRRKLNFTALAAADVVAEVAFVVVALLLVLWWGLPAWSLPGGLAARFTVHAIAIWIADPHLPRGWPTRQAGRDFARFSVAAWGSRIVYVLSSNADYLLVGRLLGSSALGFYGMAWDLLRFVPDRLYRVAGRVTFPAFCQLQDDHEALSRAYLDFFDYIARVVLPIAACAAIAAPEILRTIYGPQWVPSVLPMRLLAPGLALCGLRLGIGSVFYSKNHPALDMYLHGVRLTLLVVAVLGLARWGLFRGQPGNEHGRGFGERVRPGARMRTDRAEPARPGDLGDSGIAPDRALRARDGGRKNGRNARWGAWRDRFGCCGRAAGAGLSMDGALERDGPHRQGIRAGRDQNLGSAGITWSPTVTRYETLYRHNARA